MVLLHEITCVCLYTHFYSHLEANAILPFGNCNSHLAKYKHTVCSQIENRKLPINTLVLCKCIYYMQTEAFFFLGLWTMSFMYVCFAGWNGPFSLACLQVLMKSEPAACRSHYLVILSLLVHTQPEKSVKFILCCWPW